MRLSVLSSGLAILCTLSVSGAAQAQDCFAPPNRACFLDQIETAATALAAGPDGETLLRIAADLMNDPLGPMVDPDVMRALRDALGHFDVPEALAQRHDRAMKTLDLVALDTWPPAELAEPERRALYEHHPFIPTLARTARRDWDGVEDVIALSPESAYSNPLDLAALAALRIGDIPRAIAYADRIEGNAAAGIWREIAVAGRAANDPAVLSRGIERMLETADRSPRTMPRILRRFDIALGAMILRRDGHEQPLDLDPDALFMDAVRALAVAYLLDPRKFGSTMTVIGSYIANGFTGPARHLYDIESRGLTDVPGAMLYHIDVGGALLMRDPQSAETLYRWIRDDLVETLEGDVQPDDFRDWDNRLKLSVGANITTAIRHAALFDGPAEAQRLLDLYRMFIAKALDPEKATESVDRLDNRTALYRMGLEEALTRWQARKAPWAARFGSLWESGFYELAFDTTDGEIFDTIDDIFWQLTMIDDDADRKTAARVLIDRVQAEIDRRGEEFDADTWHLHRVEAAVDIGDWAAASRSFGKIGSDVPHLRALIAGGRALATNPLRIELTLSTEPF